MPRPLTPAQTGLRCGWPRGSLSTSRCARSLPATTRPGEERRRELEGVYLRALELAAHASLRIGGGELDTAERSARSLVRLAPFRESGYRYLMEVLAARDNRAEALQVYDELRTMLKAELGTTPSPATKELHRTLLG